ncbi:MAG: DPP IV N-terminal domain-containing protein, partial [Planctomycetes bacterium]|nr:DPP IV N-terminal domain-containing protein [Planctomycetota bacterium]
MFRIVALFALALFAPFAHAQPLQTVAEKSEYKATSKYADVVAFCEAIAKRGPTARLEYFGTSHDGRKLPLLVVSDPPVSNAEEAKKSDKLVVMAFANIHAGEVDGKEALLALARDLTDKKDHPLLKDLVILLVPILNADGNERIDPKNRPGDNGPVDGAGIRENAQKLDLNRDFVKLETPEVRALVKLFNTWDPAMVIDCHTTNGSNHRHTLTYDGPRYPSSDRGIWTRHVIFPDVKKRMKERSGFDIAAYGNFSQDRTKWETYPALPRYGVQYLSLRGQIGILSESYSYAPFKDRVKASSEFVLACFESAAAHKTDVLRTTDTKPPWSSVIEVRTETEAFPGRVRILGFEEEDKDGKWIATDKLKDYYLKHVGAVKPTEYVERPLAGYFIPPSYTTAIETIRRHGITVEELREDIDLNVEVYRVQTVDTVARPFQKHQLVSVEVKKRSETRRVPAGTVRVRTTQPLGTLAAYLLEPRSEDGLTTWGMFNDGLKPGEDFPVMRLRKAHPLTVGPLAPLPENRVVNQPVTEALLIGHGGGFSFGLQGSPVSVGDWLDAEHFLQTKEGKLWKVEARTGKAEPFADPEKIAKSLKALKDLEASEFENITQGRFFRMTPDRAAFTFNMGPDIALAYFDGRPAVRLTKSDGSKESVTFSPDSKRLAFVRNGNLFVVDFEKPEEKQLTHDGGSNDILNGQADWVYEEEIFNRDGKAFWWSGDGKQLAFMRFDDSPVKKFNIVNLNPVRGQLETYPYPKVGDPNPLVKIGVVSASGGKPVFLDFGEHKPEDIVIARVGWLPDSKTVFAYVQNRSQTWMDFTTWATPDAKPKVLFRDSTKAWVDDTGPPHWLPDGSFLYASDRSGWRHLYHFAANGKLLGPVTTGEWEVKDVLRVDGGEKQIYFTATYTSHTGIDLCRVKLGEKTELLT